MAILKIWLNAVCTSRRFQMEPIDCPLCLQANADTLEHLCQCPWLVDAATATLKFPVIPSLSEFCLLQSQGRRLRAEHGCALAALHAFVMLKAYNAARVCTSASPSFYRSTIVGVASKCKGTLNLTKSLLLPPPRMIIYAIFTQHKFSQEPTSNKTQATSTSQCQCSLYPLSAV